MFTLALVAWNFATALRCASDAILSMISRILRLCKWVSKLWGAMKMVKDEKVVEKIVELRFYRSGLKIAVGMKNTQNSSKTKNFGLFRMVPVAGLEPARCRHRWILSPLRLPIPSHRHIYNVL